jgi:hypothetical protein
MTGYSQRVWRKNFDTKLMIITNNRNFESISNSNSDHFLSRYQSETIIITIKKKCARKTSLNAKKGTSAAMITKEKPKLTARFSIALRVLKRLATAMPGINDIKKTIII